MMEGGVNFVFITVRVVYLVIAQLHLLHKRQLSGNFDRE